MPVLATWMLAGAIAAPAVPITLEWQAPAGCPDAAAVTAMIAELLRRRAPDGPPMRARGTVTRIGERLQLELAFHPPEGELHRTMSASDCLLLARGAALLLAVHLDPLAVTQALDEPAPPTVPEPPAPPPAAAAPAPDPRRADLSLGTDLPSADLSPGPGGSDLSPGPGGPVDLSPGPGGSTDLSPGPGAPAGLVGHLRVEGGLDVGVLPGVGGDIGLGGGVGGARWRVDLGVVGVPARTRAVDGVVGRFDRVAGVVRGCAVWRVPAGRGRLALLGCAGAEVGAIHGTTTAGVRASSPRWSGWAGALFGAAGRLGLVGPLGLWLGAELVVALRRPEFTVGDPPVNLYTVAPAGVRANFGIDLQFVARKRRPRATQ